ncbi:hypothetical protein AB1Y20_003531 [Prymnesium parvum]|uniref:Uncharacterized protein n=1 Tax=Prymnesium parvum TaxID=97485 RepID=A0AB34J4Y0_PRYPA
MVEVRRAFSARRLPAASITASPRPSVAPASSLLLLLAFDAWSSDDSLAVGSLLIAPAASPFARHAAALRLLPATRSRQLEVGGALLRYAARHEPCLRGGGALLACAAGGGGGAGSGKKRKGLGEERKGLGEEGKGLGEERKGLGEEGEGVGEEGEGLGEEGEGVGEEGEGLGEEGEGLGGVEGLERLGFVRTGSEARAAWAGEEAAAAGEVEMDAPILSFRGRFSGEEGSDGRGKGEGGSGYRGRGGEVCARGGGLVAMRVSDVEVCLAFWSLLEYYPTVRFTTSGARAACLAATWSAQELEVVEVPSFMLPQGPEAEEERLGLSHVTIDVTPISVCLADTLEDLQTRSVSKFRRTLRVLIPPHQQMLGNLVVEAVVVRAPDGVQLRLMRRVGLLEQELQPDWASA